MLQSWRSSASILTEDQGAAARRYGRGRENSLIALGGSRLVLEDLLRKKPARQFVDGSPYWGVVQRQHTGL